MALTDRVARLESLVGKTLGDGFHDLVFMALKHEDQINNLRQSLIDLRGKLENQFQAQQVEKLAARMKMLEDELTFVKSALSHQHAANEIPTYEICVPEPKRFNGVRSAKVLGNFIWDLDQYFKLAKIPTTEQVDWASMLLVGDAKLWWRVIRSVGWPKIADWEAMKKEMKKQFLPHNTARRRSQRRC